MSALPEIRLLLSDVDGTLVAPDKTLTEAAKAAVRELAAAGVAFAVTSSRPPRGMRMLIAPLALQTPIAGCNGGVFVNPDLSLIESHVLASASAQTAVGLFREKGLDVWVYTQDAWLVRDAGAAYVAHEAGTLDFEPTVVASFTDDHLAGAVKIVGVSPNFALVDACAEAMREALGAGANATRSQSYFLDVTHPLANKGEVVSTLSKLMNVPPAQIATIGDMPNDVLMFRKSGFSIAMGNASDAVKAQASAVTDTNANDGFANAVRTFVLPRAANCKLYEEAKR
jgi:Cof subfamily protein (haloacid dehalogenase superfamily)